VSGAVEAYLSGLSLEGAQKPLASVARLLAESLDVGGFGLGVQAHLLGDLASRSWAVRVDPIDGHPYAFGFPWVLVSVAAALAVEINWLD
jgi:hypothetical protein